MAGKGVVGGRPVHDRECAPAKFGAFVAAGAAQSDESPAEVEAMAHRYADRRLHPSAVRKLGRRAVKRDDGQDFPCAVCAQPITAEDLVAIVPLQS